MQYDGGWTAQERARVEALRLIRQGKGRTYVADELAAEADTLAKFIAGPEAANPFPWDEALAARQDLVNLYSDARKAAGQSGHLWTVPTEGETVTLDAFALYQALHKLPDNLPF